ncbi:hypothetical protein F2Q65_08710 [Thiohalocapsa marina]|uniref:Uncharacterized protein n=1 Tax=Thiohalocapsa marina TaxID=424902 RepID=A0A5M8FSM8_9GAMM|nr:hypothetical protein F2Q65_08710 [Thiohalocapsa marina]
MKRFGNRVFESRADFWPGWPINQRLPRWPGLFIAPFLQLSCAPSAACLPHSAVRASALSASLSVTEESDILCGINRAERIYRLHTLLQQKPRSLAKLQEAPEAFRDTVVRDLGYMKDFMGTPIEYACAINGYRYSPNAPRFELPGFWLNKRELYALLATERLLEVRLAQEAPSRVRRDRGDDASGDGLSDQLGVGPVRQRTPVARSRSAMLPVLDLASRAPLSSRLSAALTTYPCSAGVLARRRRIPLSYRKR